MTDEAPAAPGLLQHTDVAEWHTSADGLSSELWLRWPEGRQPPGRRDVLVHARAALGPLEHRWTFDAGSLPEAGELPVVVFVPAEAQLDPAVADYVVDLVLDVEVGGQTVSLKTVWLAWPEGLDQPAVVWTHELGEQLAPHGVLDQAVRDEADLAGVEGRLLPLLVVYDEVRPSRGIPDLDQGRLDTGLYAAGEL